MSKTGRKRGVIVAAIRRVASRGRRFTIRPLLKVMTPEQANGIAQCLLNRGELKRVKRGLPGRWGGIVRAVYQRS